MNQAFFQSPEWEQIKKRYRAFWEGESLGRPLLHLTQTAPARDTQELTLEQQWLDEDRVAEQACYIAENTVYHADAFPTCFVNLGPGVLSACIGGDFMLAPDTVWFDRNPILQSRENLAKIRFYHDSPMWGHIRRLTDACVAHSDKFCISLTDIGGTVDIVASLRGSEPLLYDLFDAPDLILDAIAAVEPLWEYIFDALANPLLEKQGGMCTWMPIWCDGRYAPLQCDFSAMISPDMFAEFVLPNLKQQTEFLDHAVYHLDGPGEIPHLEQLLSLPRLDAIQWTAGAGEIGLEDPCWFEMYDRIFAAGKGLVLMDVPADGVEMLLKRYHDKRLFIEAHSADAKRVEELNQLHQML